MIQSSHNHSPQVPPILKRCAMPSLDSQQQSFSGSFISGNCQLRLYDSSDPGSPTKLYLKTAHQSIQIKDSCYENFQPSFMNLDEGFEKNGLQQSLRCIQNGDGKIDNRKTFILDRSSIGECSFLFMDGELVVEEKEEKFVRDSLKMSIASTMQIPQKKKGNRIQKYDSKCLCSIM